jgi:hypothetical protein
MDQNKLFALEERLRAVEGNDWFDPMRVAEVCLVPNIVVPKDFRILDSLSTLVWNAQTLTFDPTVIKWLK